MSIQSYTFQVNVLYKGREQVLECILMNAPNQFNAPMIRVALYRPGNVPMVEIFYVMDRGTLYNYPIDKFKSEDRTLQEELQNKREFSLAVNDALINYLPQMQLKFDEWMS